MIYPINIKKKIKESRSLKENVRSVASVASWLKDSIAAMTANQELTISRRILDSNFGFYVYWTQGFDVNDDSVIHADADKTYGLVAALKCRNDAEWDGEYMDCPYDPETGDLYCEDYTLSPKDNTEMVAEWLLDDYDNILDVMNKNPHIIIGGLKESKSFKESYDPEDCYTVWEIKDTSTGEIKRIHSYDKDPEDFSTWLDDDEIINQYADEDTVITRFVYDNGLLDTSEVIWPEDLNESKCINEEFSHNLIKEETIYLPTSNGKAGIHVMFISESFDDEETQYAIDIDWGAASTIADKIAQAIWKYSYGDARFIRTSTGAEIHQDRFVDSLCTWNDEEYKVIEELYDDIVDALIHIDTDELDDSKSIKEGLSAKEVLEQAKKLLEK